jgi:thiamine transport system substrate-binding protein
MEASCYIRRNVDVEIRLDEQLDATLLDSLEGDLEGSGRVKDSLQFDPNGHGIPFDTGYISLVYDEGEVEPTTFADLIAEQNRGEFITQNAQQSDTGRAFMLWTIKEFGADGYHDYWQALQATDVRILCSWNDAYIA